MAASPDEIGQFIDLYKEGYHSFSGSDVRVFVTSPGIGYKYVNNVATVSYSIHREKFPVRCVGRNYIKDHTRGIRTIAGSIILTILGKHGLWELDPAFYPEENLFKEGFKFDEYQNDKEPYSIIPDMYNKFNMGLEFQNEYGRQSNIMIYGVNIVDEGQTHSVNDLVTECVFQYTARDIDIMYPVGWNPKYLSKENFKKIEMQTKEEDLSHLLNADRLTEKRVSQDEMDKQIKEYNTKIREINKKLDNIDLIDQRKALRKRKEDIQNLKIDLKNRYIRKFGIKDRKQALKKKY